MAIKIKRKRADEPEVEVAGEETDIAEPDEILVASAETFSWLQDNRNVVLGAIGALLVGIVVVSTVRNAQADGRADDSLALFAALDVATSETGESSTYDGLAAREQALVLAAESAAGRGAELGDDANLLLARSALLQGDGAGALTRYQAASAELEGSPEAVIAQFGVAASFAASGDLAQAIALLDTVAADERLALSARTLAARLTDTYGERQAAYDAFTALVDDFAGVADTYAFEDRATQLAIELGIAEEVADGNDEG